MTPFQRYARTLVHHRLAAIRHGQLVVREAGESSTFGGRAGPRAVATVHDARFYTAVLRAGHIGAAESYASGWWTTDHLTDVIRLFLLNRDALDGLEKGLGRLVQPVRALMHGLRRNTRSGSRRNIAAHYDLGNDFFELFLDETWTYSSGYFEHREATLAQASSAKYERICRKLDLEPRHHVLEIGGGWGGFAIHAAARYGCRVTSITVSEEQVRLARERVAEHGVTDRVNIVFRDYRDVTGVFDRVVSIEMIEAVGHQYYQAFFERCAALLEPDGLAAIQAITIQPQHYERARREVDFIKRYIFPGSCIPSIPALAAAWSTTDLRLLHTEDFGAHYARTLREWDRRFAASAETLSARGYDAWFQRLWRFYFAYCEAGFDERAIGVSQILLAKPGAHLRDAANRFLVERAA